jgi:hypothetical protein
VSQNLKVLVTMLAAAVGLVVPLILAFSGAADLAAGAPVGLSKVGAAALVAAGAVLVVVRVVDEGGPEGLARDRDATVVSGTVGQADGGRMREPIGAAECEAYLYLIEYQPRDGGGPLGDYDPLVSGLVAAGPLPVEAEDGVVRLRPGRAVTPSFVSPQAVAPDGLNDDVVGDPEPFLWRLGLGEAEEFVGDSFLAREDYRLRITIEPLEEGDPLTVVGQFESVAEGLAEPREEPEPVVRRMDAAEWGRHAARNLRRARWAALGAVPLGGVLVVGGLALSLT